jgi:hypothetical protein
MKYTLGLLIFWNLPSVHIVYSVPNRTNIWVTRSASPSSGEKVELAPWFEFITLYPISFTVSGICWKMHNFLLQIFLLSNVDKT